MRSRISKLRWLAQVAIAGVITVTSTSAYAELLGYRFTNVHGEQQEVGPEKAFINPASDMRFSLRAGVDRRLEIELINASGDTVERKQSSLIGANDRIQHGGATHYGAMLQLASPTDGEYELINRILSSTGDVISEEKRNIVIYRRAPSVGELSIFQSHIPDDQYSGEWGKPILSKHRLQSLSLNDITSDIPLSNIIASMYDEAGNKLSEITSEITSSGAASVDSSVLSGWGEEGEYSIEIEAFDVAGNRTKVSFDFFYDTSDGASSYGYLEPVAVYDPTQSSSQKIDGKFTLEGHIPYTPWMAVNQNPIYVIFKLAKENYIEYSPYGLGRQWGNSYQVVNDIVHESEDHVYIRSHAHGRPNLDSPGRHELRFRSYDRMLNSQLSEPVQIELSDSALIGPVNVDSRVILSDGREVTGAYLGLDEKDVRIVGSWVEVEPRSYPQRIYFIFDRHPNYNVIIPPGETRAEVSLDISPYELALAGDHIFFRKYHRIYGMEEGSEFGTANIQLQDIYIDIEPPEIRDVEYDRNTGLVTMKTYESAEAYYSNHSHFGHYYINFNASSIEMQNSSGQWFDLNHFQEIKNNHWERDFIFSTQSIPNGKYTRLRATVVDRFGNRTIKTVEGDFVLDEAPPNVDIVFEGAVASLDDITIRVTDNIDQNPTVTNARITGGPANDDVNLATVRQPGSVPTFGLEYPVIFPSMAEGEEYQLEVTARDANGNVTVERKTFRYEPSVVSLSTGGEGAVRIPARVAAFLRNGGGDVVQSEPLLLSGGAPVAGTYDVYATLRTDAEVPLIINGVRVTPGDTQEIMGQHNFSTSGGRLSIPVFPAEDGVIGTSTILVTTTAPNAPVLLVDIETWEGEANFTGSDWTVRQVVDPLSYTASPTSTTFCRFSTRESEARQADAISDPTCFFAWDRLPGELKPVERRGGEEAVPAVEGVVTDQGAQSLAYSLYMFDSRGAKVKVGGGTRTLTVQAANEAIAFAPVGDYSKINRVLDNIDLRMGQTSGMECLPTLSEATARTAAERNGYDPARRTCYFEWSQVPSGLSQSTTGDTPQLLGTIGAKGDHTLRWNAYLFSPGGYRVAVAQQSHILTAVDPDAPSMDLTSDYLHEGNTYIVPQNRNSLGGLIVDGLPTDIRLDIKRGAEQIENDVFTAGWGARNRLVRNLRTGQTPVWQETLHSAAAIYEKVPEIRTVGEFKVITAPSEDILPLLEMDSTTVLDTEPMQLTVKMRSMMDRDGAYDPNQMGTWRVRLLNQRSFNEQEPMTEFVEAVNGEAVFQIEMERLTDAGLRLVAEAQLVSPIEGYERVVTSRPTFVQVLRGGAIDGDVTSRRFTGPAPLTAVFRIELEDRLDQQALGDVVWQLSTDDGATWVDQPPDPRRQTQFYNTFDEGEYLLRAFMKNQNSGAESYTEQVQVVSYTQPEVTINGPGVLFVGDTHTYHAEVTVPETAQKSADEAIVEWSLDAGETWTHTGRELELTSPEEARFALRARTRMPEAPEIDRNAYDEARLMVNFRKVTAPRVRVRSYTLLEEGRPYSINASATVPYRGMAYEIKGYFTLPDGTTQEGREIEYTPTLADAEAGTATFTYTAWVDGFKEETLSTGTSTSRVWQYVWPEFYVTQRVSTDVAPAQVSMSIRHRNGARNLDNPTYEWQLPEGIEELQERGDTTRLFKITEPGQHHVRVTVQDERGHSSLIEHVIELGVPDPYDINLRYTPSNSFMREPLDVRLRPTYRGGHPHDRVNNQRFRVNGEVIAEGSNSAVATLPAGRHEVVFEIETNYGVHDQKSFFIDVVPNQIPVCELALSESLRNWIVRAECSDEDGRVRNYHWLVNGEENSRTSNRLGILKRDYNDELPTVVLIAVDDSGGASLPVQITP